VCVKVVLAIVNPANVALVIADPFSKNNLGRGSPFNVRHGAHFCNLNLTFIFYKIYLPCNYEVNLISHLGVIALFSSNL
jgi:hypothetical protein